ncbi:MAG: hypothetical protein SOW48_03205 [Peptoniphilaceae bacterium]|nr:hypothetical protein [Peptoniphilaceae bacterium]MDY3075636.1 hypothetical protein [Peptoniphilaceae bacterium]MDY5842291.1 hypothetical protein [Peptoniphilaceae bacterium]
MKKGKKLLAVALCLPLLAGFVPNFVFANSVPENTEETKKVTTAKIEFRDDQDRSVVASGTYEVDPDGDGSFNLQDVNKLLPKGYQKLEGTMVYLVSSYQDKVLTLQVSKALKVTTAKIEFLDDQDRSVVASGTYEVDPDGDGYFKYDDVNKYLPEGYQKLEGTMVYLVSDYQDGALQILISKAPKVTTAKIEFLDDQDRSVVASGTYEVDLDGDGFFNLQDIQKYVPEGYQKLEGTMVYLVSDYQEEALKIFVTKEKTEVPLTPLEPATPIQPEEPQDPTEVPLTPLEPATPIQPADPNTTGTTDVATGNKTEQVKKTPAKDSKKENVKTGDTTKVLLLGAVMVVALGGAVTLQYAKRK